MSQEACSHFVDIPIQEPSGSHMARGASLCPLPFLLSRPHLQLLLTDEVCTKQGASKEPKPNHQVLGLIQYNQRSI